MRSPYRVFALFTLSALLTTGAVAEMPKAAPKRGPATLKELMTLAVEPASNGVFQAASEPPKKDADWKTLQGQALTLLELADTLTSPARAKDKDQWMKFAQALKDASRSAFAAAMAKDANALMELSDPLYTTCANCHEHYLPK